MPKDETGNIIMFYVWNLELSDSEDCSTDNLYSPANTISFSTFILRWLRRKGEPSNVSRVETARDVYKCNSEKMSG